MNFFSLFKKQYCPLNIIEINKSNLLHNFKYLSHATKGQIAPVLKSNAYGHGIVQVAKILDKSGAPFFCVDSIYEGYELLKAKIKTPIFIMGYVDPENLKVKKLPFSYAVYTEEMLEAVKKYQPQAEAHILVDTGMHREGVLLKNLPEFIIKAQQLGLHIEGLMSHFAMADKSKDTNTQLQVKHFLEAKQVLERKQVFPRFVHMTASSGSLHIYEYPKDLFNVSRVGISLYGIDLEEKNKNLRPILTLITTIAQIKKLERGEKVGYDFTFTAKKNMEIAILPIGYNDGVNRRLSNKGFVKIKNKFCPIVGKVSMNITVVDISLVPDVKVGEKVIIYSDNPSDKNSIFNSAKICNVIPYEILVQLHASTKRIVV